MRLSSRHPSKAVPGVHLAPLLVSMRYGSSRDKPRTGWPTCAGFRSYSESRLPSSLRAASSWQSPRASPADLAMRNCIRTESFFGTTSAPARHGVPRRRPESPRKATRPLCCDLGPSAHRRPPEAFHPCSTRQTLRATSSHRLREAGRDSTSQCECYLPASPARDIRHTPQ